MRHKPPFYSPAGMNEKLMLYAAAIVIALVLIYVSGAFSSFSAVIFPDPKAHQYSADATVISQTSAQVTYVGDGGSRTEILTTQAVPRIDLTGVTYTGDWDALPKYQLPITADDYWLVIPVSRSTLSVKYECFCDAGDCSSHVPYPTFTLTINGKKIIVNDAIGGSCSRPTTLTGDYVFQRKVQDTRQPGASGWPHFYSTVTFTCVEIPAFAVPAQCSGGPLFLATADDNIQIRGNPDITNFGIYIRQSYLPTLMASTPTTTLPGCPTCPTYPTTPGCPTCTTCTTLPCYIGNCPTLQQQITPYWPYGFFGICLLAAAYLLKRR